ncbi:MAG: PRD domain-containing protein [Clostridium butyricum]|nr:PRD domain-containing protein [Clostridium butyricum]
MKRIEKIYQYILDKASEINKEELLRIKGISAQEIEESTGILRSNVSRELNTLCRNKKVIKIKHYPMLYFDRNYFEEILDIQLPEEIEEIEDIDSLIMEKKSEEIKSPFDNLIGCETSLKNQIDQAKAALMYPPYGLHTLIIGSTGVGKSLFANIMYKYYIQMKGVSDDIPFVIFNCADYYNNPQLLLSYIFGHVKGAFTGADKDKEGIIEKADGGILFLDEIHRLPPEGQEMVFYFMDTGTYNKLGETGRNRKANVLLIGATTENPKSTLLDTFVRRIPITITIPDFEERPIKEKIELINYLISKESQRVSKSIKIDEDVIKALIGSTSYGNIGQLKSNIQLICAKGFLNSIKDKTMINIVFDDLPENIKEGIFNFKSNKKDDDVIPKSIIINTDGKREFLEAYEDNFNIYNIIESKMDKLLKNGKTTEEIDKLITTDINNYLKKIYARFTKESSKREGLFKIVDKKIIEFVEEMKNLAEKRLNKHLDDRFIYAISLHLSALFERIKNNELNNKQSIQVEISRSSIEYNIAEEIYIQIKNKFNITIPNIEIKYLAMLLNSVQQCSNNKVGIVVIAHGDSTATSMVNFAKKLFDMDNIAGVDMPFESTSKEILNYTIKKVIDADEGKGVLLLVDMGSLNNLAETIAKQCNVKVKSISMVSTPIVLEAVRKSLLPENDLETIYSYLIEDVKRYTNLTMNNTDDSKEKVIVTICSTGKGTAEKLKNLVEEHLADLETDKIKVIPLELSNLNKTLNKLSDEKNILALVGVAQPNVNNIPFIPLEKLIDGTGKNIIRNIVEGKTNFNFSKNEIYDDKNLETVCKDTINEFTTFLNSDKMYPLLSDFVEKIEEITAVSYDNFFKMRIMIHVACAVERVLLNNQLKYEGDYSTLNKQYINITKEAAQIIEKSIAITLTDDEIYYIVNIIESYNV